MSPAAHSVISVKGRTYVCSTRPVHDRATGWRLMDLPGARHPDWQLPCVAEAFVASGAAVKAGVALPQVRVIDVAPTIAAILGVKMPESDGRVLSEILQ